MEAVALHSGVANRFRERHQLRHRRLAAVEAGVEARHLRHVGQPLAHRFDGGEVVGLMERRQRDQGTKVFQHLPA